MVVLTEQIIKGKTRLDKLEEVKNLNLWGQDLDDVSILARVSTEMRPSSSPSMVAAPAALERPHVKLRQL